MSCFQKFLLSICIIACRFTIAFCNTSIIFDPYEHTMENSLYGYLALKINERIQEKEYTNIWVIGDDSREESDVSRYEKRDKMFNWQRPTAKIIGHDLYIKCFPGRDYVRHYAAIIATYHAINHKRW